MGLMRCLEHLVDVPVANVSGVGLVKADLQLTTKLLLHQAMKFVARDEYIHALCAVIFDFDRATLSIIDRLPLFFREFRSHADSVPRRPRIDDRNPGSALRNSCVR